MAEKLKWKQSQPMPVRTRKMWEQNLLFNYRLSELGFMGWLGFRGNVLLPFIK